MEQTRKSISDTDFLTAVLAEHKKIRGADDLSGAELLGIRKLLAFLPELEAYGQTERWQSATWEKAGRLGNRVTNIAKGITAIAAVVSLMVYLYTTYV